MGSLKFKQSVSAPGFNSDLTFATTAAVIANRLVVGTATGRVKPSTATSGVRVLGGALTGATGAGKSVSVRLFGIMDLEASSGAIATFDRLRATSGSASTGTRLGGTVRKMNPSTGAATVRQNMCGIALTSAAAGTGKRLVRVFVLPFGGVATTRN